MTGASQTVSLSERIMCRGQLDTHTPYLQEAVKQLTHIFCYSGLICLISLIGIPHSLMNC